MIINVGKKQKSQLNLPGGHEVCKINDLQQDQKFLMCRHQRQREGNFQNSEVRHYSLDLHDL